MSGLKYSEGDRVRIKSLDWYNENKSKSHGTVVCGGKYFDYDMREWCGKTMTIIEAYKTCYIMKEDGAKDLWTDEMIECKVEEETKPIFKVGDRVKWFNHTCNITSIDTNENTYTYLIKHNDYREDKTFAKWVPESELSFDSDEEIKNLAAANIPNGPYTITYDSPSMNDSIIKNIIYNEIVLPDGYIFKDENGNVINTTKIVLEKKEKEYPKTFVDCCAILYPNDNFQTVSQKVKGHKGDLLFHFQKLLVTRDAYWKIAGEEMGLGKPWEPDYTEVSYEQGSPIKYVIYYTGTNITKERKCTPSYILAFPTAEMRDVFYENFKVEIEICKEFL